MSHLLLSVFGIHEMDLKYVDELAESFDVDFCSLDLSVAQVADFDLNCVIQKIYHAALRKFAHLLNESEWSARVSIEANYRASFLCADGQTIFSITDLENHLNQYASAAA